MPGCCVLGCKNSSAKGFKLFSFPSGQKNCARRQVWENLINRPDFNENFRICEVHFSENQFEKVRQDGKKLLRPYAVPDLLRRGYLDCGENSRKRRCSEGDIISESCDVEIAEKILENVNVTDELSSFQNENNANEELDVKILHEEESIETLKQKLKAALQKCREYEKKINRETKTNLESIFNKDQLYVVKNGTCRGEMWSEDTVTKGLKLYMACGTKGYEEIRRQNLPYPSIRTLQHRIRNLNFKPGILQEVLDLLKFKMESFQPEERHAALVFDEMAIRPGLQFDNSLRTVVGKPTLTVPQARASDNSIATHAMVYMLKGISTKWKQIVGYDFTANSIDPNELFGRLKKIIEKAQDIGITIRTVISDMGPQNRSLWKLLNIVAGRHTKIQNSIQHPCLPNEKLFFSPDPVHVFKNLAAALIKGHTFILSESLVQKYDLPSNEISIEPIKTLHEIDKRDVMKLCPRLKDEDLNPSHFHTMNARVSVRLISNDVAAGLLYCISKNKIEEKHRTTAWFIKVMHRWFKLLTSRYAALALSLKNMEKYDDNIEFLKSVKEIAYNLTINQTWKPFQTGIVLSTETALDVQKIYLEYENFHYIMLGRLTQDALENAFSSVRCRQPVPNAHMFRVSLRLVCLSQFEAQVKRSSYTNDNSDHLVNYCKTTHMVEMENIDDKVISELERDLCEELSFEHLDDTLQVSLFYLVGSILYKVKKNRSICSHCFESISEPKNSSSITSLNLFTKLKEFKENVLEFPKMDFFNYIYNIEIYFRKFQDAIVNNILSFDDFFKKALMKYPPLDGIPSCHDIVPKIVKIFLRSRLYFVLQDKWKQFDNCVDAHSSRSIAMRVLVKK